MIRCIEGAILFSSRADALVNPVNCKGVMGKGIAKEFARRFPEIIRPYKQACVAGALRPGGLMKVQVTVKPDLYDIICPSIILFATKDHWKNPARLEWIESGLLELRAHHANWGIKSIAMPQIGCGLGGLDWRQVKPLIEKVFQDVPLEIEVYAPFSSQSGRP